MYFLIFLLNFSLEFEVWMQKNIPKNNSHNKQFALLKPNTDLEQASLGGESQNTAL
jgi:hypothetical protein